MSQAAHGFKFSQKKETFTQIAVSTMSGGLGTPDVCDKNRQELVLMLVRSLNIPANALGAAVETRKVRCAGLKDSSAHNYEIAVFTLRHDVAVIHFGATLSGRFAHATHT